MFLAVVAVYSNHFGNGFHFDDGHTILENPAIRSLANVPRFFADAGTFSHLPTGQTYRPLVTTSLALDYWMAKGLNPVWFHVSTFIWYLVQLLLMYWLYLYVLERSCPGSRNSWVAWFAVAVYGLHPASAETINYIIQRGDLYVALGVVASVLMYACKPEWRRLGLYLIPPLGAMFSKAPALIFAPLLFAYIFLIDRVRPVARKPGRDTSNERVESLSSCALRSVPAFVLCVAFSYLERSMTPPTFFQPTIATFDYWITQPYVTLRYFRSFFLPLYLNVDSGLPAFHSLGNPLVLIGFVFCALLLAVAVITARTKEWRPVSFGLWWFVIGLIPTAVYPLSDVENDHRMFLPFVGLSLAVVSAAALLLSRHGSAAIRGGAVAGLVVLVGFAYGTHSRNTTWHTDESLWRDDVEKNPDNARGHGWLGVALSKIPGRLPEATQEFQTALRIKPDDANAYLNLGKMFAEAPGRSAEAIQEFETALRFEPNLTEAHWNLGAALSKTPGGLPDAIREFETVLRLDPDSFEAHLGLGVALSQVPDRLPEAIAECQAALRLRPEDVDARRNLGLALARVPGRLPEAIQELEAVLRMTPDSAEAHANLGATLSLIPDRLPDAVKEYEAALRIDPNSSIAHFNLGVCLSRLPGRLPDSIKEYEAALRIRPDNFVAHMNLGAAFMAIPGRLTEAISEFQWALKLRPDSWEPHSNLGVAFSQVPGRLPEAIAEFEASYRIKPDPAMRKAIDNLRANIKRQN